jgi:hypothetical protein
MKNYHGKITPTPTTRIVENLKVSQQEWTKEFRRSLEGCRVERKRTDGQIESAVIWNTQDFPGTVRLSEEIDGLKYWNLDSLTVHLRS